MTSTLKTELRALSDHYIPAQSGTLKFSSVEVYEKSFEMGRHFARGRDGKNRTEQGLT